MNFAKASIRDVVDAQSVAVIGASRDILKPGAMLIEHLKDVQFQGRVMGVNPQGGEVHGIPLYRSLDEIPFPVDLAVLLIPPAAVPEAIARCARKGVKGVVISSEGFAEAGSQGKQYQEAVRSILRSTGMRGFGPNTLGIINTVTGLSTSYIADKRMLQPGSIGFASQSGIFVGGLLKYISGYGLHISKGLGMGNKVDVDESEALKYLEQDEQTRTVGMYLEDIRDGRKFLAACRETVRKKPVLLLKSGRSPAVARAVTSHTGSLAVDDAILDGALRQAGILRMQGTQEFVGALMGFDWMPLPRGNRIAVVTYSGAQSIMCMDEALKADLVVPPVSENTRGKLSKVIATPYKNLNPIDLYPDMMAHGFEETVSTILQVLMEDDAIHGIIIILFAQFGPEPYHPIVRLIHEKRNKPVFFSNFGAKEDVQSCQDLLLEHRIPCFPYPELAVQAFAHMWRYARVVSRNMDERPNLIGNNG
ncbi:acetate--CoA ligase family protein [Thermodesulfobacteriota bacterium]